MDTPRANYKFNEAHFFLLLLQEEPQRGEPAFGYYLSAFLNAAYSVVEVLEREVKTALKAGAEKKKEAKAKFDAWYDTWQAGLAEDDRALWSAMNIQRGEEVHKLGAQTVAETRIIPVDFRLLPPGIIASREAKIHHFEIAGERQEVVDTCYRYERLLQRLLSDFHRSPLATVS